jgi:hypothetical protein
MKRYGLLIVIAIAGCVPHYTSGKTQCSDKNECPSGYVCGNDGKSAANLCFDNGKLACDLSGGTAFYCVATDSCWSVVVACNTVVNCGTATATDYRACSTPTAFPDCNGKCVTVDGGVASTGGVRKDGGLVGTGGAGGSKDAAVRDVLVADVFLGSGGADAGITARGGTTGTGGIIGMGGLFATGGLFGTGGVGGKGGVGGLIGVGGVGGKGGVGGIIGVGGVTGRGGGTGVSTLCTGTAYLCSNSLTSSECLYENGCSWASDGSCIGTASACGTYSGSTACEMNGCTWTGTLVCTKSTITTFCMNMMSTTDACDVCLSNACCAQYTNCYNDIDCYSGVRNATWNAYVDCGVNCCKTACNI